MCFLNAVIVKETDSSVKEKNNSIDIIVANLPSVFSGELMIHYCWREEINLAVVLKSIS